MDLTMPLTKSETTLAHSWNFEALGTFWEVASKRPISDEVKAAVIKELSLFELTYSRFISDSFVSMIAKNPGTYTFAQSADEIFSFYEDLYALTGGKVTPLVGDMLASAGYDAQYSLKPAEIIKAIPPYEQVVRRQGNVITTKQPVTFDIGAAGKGYAVDMITKVLLDGGYDDFLVDASGDMRAVGGVVESVGLEDPRNSEEVIGIVKLHNKALCASAVNRRAWGDWHHVVDPKTGAPTRQILATWVVADSTMIADGLATALFFVAPEVLSTKYNYEYLRMHADGSVEYSDYFAGGLFS